MARRADGAAIAGAAAKEPPAAWRKVAVAQRAFSNPIDLPETVLPCVLTKKGDY
jgi:hypothetical protein